MLNKFIDQIKGQFTGEILINEPLSKHTYFKIGGEASVLLIPKSVEDLKLISKFIQDIPFVVMGAGSNLLVSDEGFKGIVIRTMKLNLTIEYHEDKKLLNTGSSVSVSSLLRKAAQRGWDGLDFLTGIPGTIGGVATMNAGTHIGEAKDRLHSIEVFDLISGEINAIEVKSEFYSYRKNHFLKPNQIIYSANWKIDFADPKTVNEKISDLLKRRKSSQPVDFPSCGSTFMNPKDSGKHAWQVIDELGLRGHRIGDAQFSELHCNFILNHGHAKASDVKALIDLAKDRAKQEMGITLQEEVKYLGF